MLPLWLGAVPEGRPLRLLAIGAHADDVEIGAGGTLMQLIGQVSCEVRSIIVSTDAVRASEARASAAAFFSGATSVAVATHDVPDGRFPEHWGRVKSILQASRAAWAPDMVFAPSLPDAHQDHRLLAELVPTVFRDQLVLGYEIPKWDGDFWRPTVYVRLSEEEVRRKTRLLREHFVSQLGHDWFDDEVFLGLARLRGVECHSRYAEAFGCHKLLLGHG